MKYHLVTTSLEQTWKTNDTVLFLGTWCQHHERKEKWSTIDYKVAPYHWDDIDLLIADEKYCDCVYEELLVELSSFLNKYHNIEWPIRSWRLVLGPWLRRYVSVLRDRWLSIQSISDKYQISSVLCGRHYSGCLSCKDFSDFSRLSKDDVWNYYLYSLIIHKITTYKVEYLDIKL